MLPVATSVVPADGNLGRRVSRLYAGNLIGSALGALVASGLLLAALGIEFSVRAASLVALATSVLVVLTSPKLHVVTTAMAMFGAVSILALDPSGGRLVTSFGLYSSAPSYLEYDEYDANRVRELVASHDLLYYRDGPAATVAVQQVDRYTLLKINGKTDASNRGADVETQILLGHLPLMAADARHVAVIGWGSGMTAGAVLSHPVESVDAFEIEPAVVEASRYFEPSNGRPLNDPSRDFRFTCPRWPLYTPEGRPAHETLVRHSIVPLQRPSAQPVVTCGRLEALFSRHFSDTAPPLGHFFANRTALPVPRVSLPAPAAPRSSATCRRTAVGSDALPPAGASSTWHASPTGLRFSPAAAGDS